MQVLIRIGIRKLYHIKITLEKKFLKGIIKNMSGTLYIVGTPIGNLGDFSPRGVKTLSEVDFIAAEDTRVSIKILNHFNIKKPLISYFEHNKDFRGQEILKRLQNGESCALVTDAGMPAISDPGEDLVALCSQNGIKIVAVPGPCAAVTALAMSSLPCGRFCFEGFLSMNKKLRKEHLASLIEEQRTIVFYEAPHKLKSTLNDLLKIFGERRISLAREITKIHEEVITTTLSESIEFYSQNDPRGEFVLIIEGAKPKEENQDLSEEQRLQNALELIDIYIAEGNSRTQAVKRASKEMDVSRSELYKLTLKNLKKD
jgi:16S rRNA (cytidine1402-2'-O)-methyltransferase